MSDLSAILDQFESLAESWRDDTAPEPHVSELLDLAAHFRAAATPVEFVVAYAQHPDYDPVLDANDPTWTDERRFLLVLLCGACGEDAVCGVDRAERWNRIIPQRGETDAVTEHAGSAGDGWEGVGFVCAACSADLVAPAEFDEISVDYAG